MNGSEDEKIRTKRAQSGRGYYGRRAAFTLVELLVVVGVIASLTAIMVPVLGAARRKAYSLVGMTRLKHIATSLNSFALENNNYYPPSVSSYSDGASTDPRVMASTYNFQSQHRSIGQYLNEYIEDAEVLHCPSSPDQYPYLKEMWAAGDDWVYPGRASESKMTGHYSFYWNYDGLFEVEEDEYERFYGPSRPALGKRESDLLVCDSLVEYDHQTGEDYSRPPEYITSCEYFDDCTVSTGKTSYVDRWLLKVENQLPVVRLKAAFVDCHVETYKSNETEAIGMRPILKNGRPWDLGSASGGSLGRYYLPANARP